MTLRSRLTLSGLAGVAGGVALTGGAIFLVRGTGLTPPVTGLWVWALLVFLLLFSLAEIPLMIFGMCRLASSPSGMRPAVLTNAAFTFFAAVYATPFLLLTGRVAIGVMLTGLCLVRFAGALLFVGRKSDVSSQMTDSPETLGGICALLIDMDGVLWRGDAPMPGLNDFFELLRSRPIPFRLVTNNASKTPEQYVDKLTSMGVRVTYDEILTSAIAAAQHIAGTAPGASVYVIGEKGLQQAVLDYGLRLSDGGQADFVAVGWDQKLSFNKLSEATLLIRDGAKFIGCNPDLTWPGERGLLPGNGATLAFLQASTGVAPLIIGKPERAMFDAALAALGVDPTYAAVLGDRLETDILGGQNAGLRTILVLTGATDRAILDVSQIQPDWVFKDIQELTQAWSKLL